MRLWPLLAILWPVAASAEITSAHYIDPTEAYGHNALADGEYGALEITTSDNVMDLSYEDAVFEDTEPRLYDFDGDGSPEVVSVLSSFEYGSSIQIFTELAGTVIPLGGSSAIGEPHRWMAIAGIADFDNDGASEIAFVDRPHLAKILRFLEVRRDGRKWIFTPDGEVAGLTNHHLGSGVIEGGLRDCSQPEVVTADAGWARIMVTSFDGSAYVSRDVGPYAGADSLEAALDCN